MIVRRIKFHYSICMLTLSRGCRKSIKNTNEIIGSDIAIKVVPFSIFCQFHLHDGLFCFDEKLYDVASAKVL